MNTPRTRLLLLIAGGLALLAIGMISGYVLGGLSAASRAAYAGNAASLVYFTGIHQALEAKRYDRAETITASAVDSHVAVLRQLRAPASGCFIYVLPWSHHLEAETSHGALARTRDYFAGHADQLRPETRAFLAEER